MGKQEFIAKTIAAQTAIIFFLNCLYLFNTYRYINMHCIFTA